MERPLEDVRPVGPFVSNNRNTKEQTEYNALEIHINEDHEPYKYSVRGIPNAAPETVGIEIDTAALMINGATLSMWEYEKNKPHSEVIRGESALRITAPIGDKVKLTNASESLVEIEV